VYIGAGLSLAVALILSATFWLPYAWTYVMWGRQQAESVTTEIGIAEPGSEYADVVAELGPVSYEMPGFSRDGVPDAAVCVWQNTEAGEIRGLFMSGRLVGSLLVFE
jgi:hypothetical protein